VPLIFDNTIQATRLYKPLQGNIERRFYYNKQINMIKQTINESQFTDALKADEYTNWSYGATIALYEYFEEFEEDIELDTVAIRCDFSEYDNALEYAREFSEFKTHFEQNELTEEENEELALEFLQDRTTVLVAKTPDTSEDSKLGDYITSYVIQSF
jgi:hypothetical protein